MNISYEHANPRRGNESFLIRVEEGHRERTPCLLVDAGDGVDTDELLGEDEYLAAILLTHAHLDHYQSLGDAHRDGAPVLTSAGTASILEDVLTEGVEQYGLSNTSEILDRVEAISEWHDILGDTLRVRPVPVGHAPGACGFLIRVVDGDEQVTILATGDFTERDAAGYPGFDAAAYAGVDIVFLTAATNEEFEGELTDAISTISERTNAGSRTLCTASGLTGVHLASLLAGIDDELDVHVPVILAGQVAKLYTALGYDHDAVTTVPEYSATSDCFEHGAVTIAGPEVPIEGSSGRLSDAIADDGSASLVQVQGGNTEAATGSDFAGTVSSHRFSNHPSEDFLDEVVETISPTHVVITHQQGRALEQYKSKWDSFAWATGSRGKEVLYRDGVYPAPNWVSDYVERRVRNRSGQLDTSRIDSAVMDALDATPAAHRHDDVNLQREGVDVDALRDRLHIRATPDATSSATNGAEQVEAADEGSTHVAAGADNGLTTTDAATAQPLRTTDEGVEDETPSVPDDADATDSPAGANSFSVTVDPAVRLLAQQRAAAADTSPAVYTRNAVDAYIADILRGDEPWEDTESEADSLSLDTGPVLEQLLSTAAAEYDSVEAFALEHLRAAVGVNEAEETVPVRDDGSVTDLVNAIAENSDYPLASPSDVVEAALRRELV